MGTVRLGVDDVMPPRTSVLAHQGIPPDADVSTRILQLHTRAEEQFDGCARPVGIVDEVDTDTFSAIFGEEDDNAEDAVVGFVFPAADRLALYAATIGAEVSERIDELFADNDFALGSMLDSVASQAADRAGEALAAWYYNRLLDDGQLEPDDKVLGYSPGYCGWRVTGQQRLFAHLRPERIGISLNSRSMMTPLKSVSGVFVAAEPGVHVFEPRFSYCRDCRDRSCIDRVRPLREATRGA